MQRKIYNWKRYWCLRDGGFHIDANGFLLRGEYLNKDTIEFESIAELPCLVLLGEPGIGKSRALEDAVAFVSQSFQNDKCFRLDLRSFGNEARLYDALFRGGEIEEWLKGNYRLHFFLDSFDECLLRVDSVAAMLADELKNGKYPIDRLLFRIASRTAEFPRGLENDLREIWKSDEGDAEKIKFYELCPLQASDVRTAVEIEGIEPEIFFKEMTAKNAGTLAARPVTLRFLLDIYRKKNSFPDKLTELYEQGCRVLCDEQNDERRASLVLKGKLTADQRLQIAGRIAAVMVFCNKIAVWKDAETGATDETDVLIRELAGEFERSANIDFPVTEEAVRETLVQTGLFTARGASRLGWSHQTFTEFLAAWYIARQNLDTHQILSLVTYPSDAQKQITPQLQEAAAWLASLRPDVFDELLKTNPLLLLRSDVASFSADLRAKLVDELFKIFAAEQASDWGWHSYYPRLKHPDLAAQLLPVIKDKNAHYLARRFAIDVAEACDLRELQNDLADVILDEFEPDYVRSNAGYALWRVGDVETKKRIKHYAINGSLNDKDERVRGIALLCNWDENLTAKEVFASLVHSPHLHDSYCLFLSRFVEKIKVKDLPNALRWVKETAEQFGGDFSIERVINEIMFFGWENLDTPEVLQSFAEAALTRLRLYNHRIVEFSGIFDEKQISESLADSGKRRRVLKAFAPLLDEEKHDFFGISDSQLLRPRKEDLRWLFDELNNAKTEEEQKIWLSLLGNFYFPWAVEPDVFSILCESYQQNEAVKKYYSWVFTPVKLNTPKAKAQKENYERLTAPRKKMEAELQKNALNPPPKERVLECLERFEKGGIDFWWHLNMQLTLKPLMKVYGDELLFDLRKLPGWQEADAETQSRIIEAAKKYVVEGEPQNAEWVGTNTIFRPAFSAYRALYLLLAESPEFIEQLPAEIWQKWAATIVSYPLNSQGNDKEMLPHQFLVARAYEHAPDEVIEAILKQIDWENEKGDIILFPQRLDVCWDDKFKAALREKLNDKTLKINSWGRILEELLEHGDAPTQEIAQHILTAFIAGEAEMERALFAAASLMRHARSADWWNFVWRAVEKDADFGRAFVESVSGQTRPANKLTESEAAELYLWLIKAFPPAEDPPLPTGGGMAFFVSPRMQITDWRESIVGDLKQRGTPESLVALERIAAASPEIAKRLHWILIEARENVWRHTWQPPTPAELLALLKQKNVATILPPTAEIMKKTLTDNEIGSLMWNGETVADAPALFEFLKTYRDRPNDVVFFVGAGLSMPLFPGWNAILNEMIDETSRKFGRKFPKSEVKKMLKKGGYLEVAEACASELGRTDYAGFIRRKFRKDASEMKPIPLAYAELLKLDVKTILTTNYDQIPEVAGNGNYAVYRNTNSADAMNDFRDGRKMVFKIHGCVTEQSSIVLTRQDYQRIMYQGSELRKAVETILNSKNVIFLGFSLSDPHFDSILDELFVANRGIAQGKFALMEGLSKTEIQRKQARFGLGIIPYQKSADTHPEVLEFVRLLSQVRG